MKNENFKLVKKIENASDFGLQWFKNGSARQSVYTLYFNENPIKTYTSSNADKKIFAIIEIGYKAFNGVVIVPNIEIIYDIRFSVNQNKKTLGTRKIVVTD